MPVCRSLLLFLTFGLTIVLQLGTSSASELEDIEADIAEVEQQLRTNESTISSYGGGLLREVALLRRETLLLTQALLKNWKIVIESGAQKQFAVPAVQPDRIKSAWILDELAKLEASIEATEGEIGRSRGLVQVLSLSRLETQKLTRAQLTLAYLQAHYGIAVPELPSQKFALDQTVDSSSDDLAGSAGDAVENAAIAAPDWADPRFPNIDYDNRFFQAAHESGADIFGWWIVFEENSALDDSREVIGRNLQFFGENKIRNKSLIIGCVENQTRIIYNTDNYMILDRANVTLRIDSEPARVERWSELVSRKGLGLFGGSAIRLLRQIFDAEKLFLRISERDGARHDSLFELAGIKDVINRVATTCGWKIAHE